MIGIEILGIITVRSIFPKKRGERFEAFNKRALRIAGFY